jgi:hypothetical protein
MTGPKFRSGVCTPITAAYLRDTISAYVVLMDREHTADVGWEGT